MPKQNVAVIWSEKEQNAFDLFKTALSQAAILVFPNIEKYFMLHTDASGFGIGAVLVQKVSLGKHRVLACASRLLNKAEQNYDVIKRESLAMF